jgi:hypothetical protein
MSIVRESEGVRHAAVIIIRTISISLYLQDEYMDE